MKQMQLGWTRNFTLDDLPYHNLVSAANETILIYGKILV